MKREELVRAIEQAKADHETHLDLGFCQIDDLPREIGQLSRLTWLNLSSNRLTNLPDEIGEVSDLKVLDLRNNDLSKLPFGITDLENLETLYLSGNPVGIPFEIIEETTDPSTLFAAYFGYSMADWEEEVKPIVKRRPLREAKVLFVGEGSVGKTSLIKQLLYNKFNPQENKTDGIIIERWYTPSTSKRLRLNIWDFGGQEIYHHTHQFFLTKRSLYVLVLDARMSQEQNQVEYWLKLIQSFGADSPVLIVGNKIDQHPFDIDRTGLQKKYSNIINILEVSAATGKGIIDLRSTIAENADHLPHIRDLLPETWFKVKTKLEILGRKRNFITQDDYETLCNKNDVKDETSQHTLISFLHELGVVLHFQDDPRLEALGILNPQWVTNGVYKILNSHELFQNQGKLTLSLLNNILNLPEYPGNKRLFIVDMMKKFELCYDIEPDKSFLIPDLLPKDEPENLNFKTIPAFQYQYPVLPSSVITRFIVRMNQHIANSIAWRTGVVLKFGENRALVKADIEDKKISIYIDGLEHTRRDALSAIRYQLDEIHDSIKGLNPQKRVPIPEAPNAEPLEYDYLLQLERDGYSDFPVKEGNRLVKVDVRKLLSGIESESQRKESAANIINNIYAGGNVEGNVVAGNENEVKNATQSKRKHNK